MSTYSSKGDRLIDNTVPPRALGTVAAKTSAGANAGAGLSAFWADCPLQASLIDPGVGYGMQDNFIDAGLSPAITTIISGQGRYLLFGSAGAIIAPDGALGGGLVITEANDNEAVSITTKQTPFQITADAGSLWFEARIKTSTITVDEQGFLVGLMDDTPQTAISPITATGPIAAVNVVGFHKEEGDTTTLDCIYKANDVTVVNVNADAGTIAANTYIKLGFKFDGTNNVLSYYIDGILQANQKTVPDNTGTDFPADVTLAPVVAMLLENSSAETITMDWWKCFQLR